MSELVVFSLLIAQVQFIRHNHRDDLGDGDSRIHETDAVIRKMLAIFQNAFPHLFHSNILSCIAAGLTRPHTEDVGLLEIAVNADRTLVAASYQDGDVRVFRYPVTHQIKVRTCVHESNSL